MDFLLDSIVRRRSIVWHIRDYTLLRLAKTFNNGNLLTPTSPPMYFTPAFFSLNDLANVLTFQIVKLAKIMNGFGTQSAIDDYISSLKLHKADVEKVDPNLTIPSCVPVMVVSAPIGSVFARRFNGGIAVTYEAEWPVRIVIKTMTTQPGEYVVRRKYKTIPRYDIL